MTLGEVKGLYFLSRRVNHKENTMQNLGLILLVFAFVFAVIASCIMTGNGRWHFGWAAVAFWIASELLGSLGRVFH